MASRKPNILIAGTPGTGKTSLAGAVASQSGFNHIDVGALVKEKSLHDGYDEEFEAFIQNEDKICDEMEDVMSKGGNVVDYHTVDFFPERWFDLVIVLRTDNEMLYPRLEARGYSQKKITENIECEIMQVVQDEVYESYKSEIIIVLDSNSVQDMEDNTDKLVEWIQQWRGPQ